LLTLKKKEAQEMVIRCRGDVHTLAGTDFSLREKVVRADTWFESCRRDIEESTSVKSLDALIKQIISRTESICKEIESLMPGFAEAPPAAQKASVRNIVSVRRYDIFPVRRLGSRADIERYLEDMRKILVDTLEGADEVQLS
jgi:hypothetical protein